MASDYGSFMARPEDGYDHGPYPEHWNAEDKHLWNLQEDTHFDGLGRANMGFTESEWEDTQQAFETGFLARDVTPDQRHDAREEFFDLMGYGADSFDWEAWREFMGYDD